MTLGAFSILVGSSPRWAQNALTVLGLRPRYTVDLARRLALARELHETSGMPLVQAYPLAGRVLGGWPRRGRWGCSSPEGAVTVAIDLERFLSTFTVRLSLSRTLYAPRKPGRPSTKRRRGVALAREHGIDIGLLESSLRRTPEDRLQRLDADVSFVRTMRVPRGRGRRSGRGGRIRSVSSAGGRPR